MTTLGNIPVLMYHRVCKDNEGGRSKFVVNAEVFRQQLRFFREQGFYTPKLGDVIANVNGLHSSTKKPLLITFDDGYLDTYENATPALAEFGFRAVVFVVADFSRRTNWWDAPKHIAEAKLMEPKHMREMSALGMEFGSHGMTHRSLPLLAGKELDEELRVSKTSTEDALGAPAPYLAYPYGELDERVKLAAISAGYACAFAANSGPLYFHSDLYEIRRVLIASRGNAPYLYLKLYGVEKAFKWGEWVGKKIIGKHPAYTF